MKYKYKCRKDNIVGWPLDSKAKSFINILFRPAWGKGTIPALALFWYLPKKSQCMVGDGTLLYTLLCNYIK